jgi:hypothetical protein
MATNVLTVFFWIWGAAGLLLNTVNYFSLQGSVGVGTSTYTALGFLYWIAGMVLFGVGALIAKVPEPLAVAISTDKPLNYAVPAPVSTEPVREIPLREEPAPGPVADVQNVGVWEEMTRERVGLFVLILIATTMLLTAYFTLAR